MTQRTRTTPSPATDSGARLTGNKAAKAVLDRMLAKAITKVSDLPDKKSKLHYVADMIEAQALVEKGIGFNMYDYRSDSEDGKQTDKFGHSCGTVACIAGWTMLLEKGADYGKNKALDFHAQATRLLNLTRDESDELFTMDNSYGGTLYDVTPARAVAVIRHFADTGAVDWDSFDDEGKKIT